MQVIAVRTRALLAPKDSLFDALKASKLELKDGDIVAISSKVVSIDEGRTVPIGSIDKEMLVTQEADWHATTPRSKWRSRVTITKGAMAAAAGIDESNGNGHYILYPKEPFKSARRLRSFLMKEYGVSRIALLITDSTSIPLRRGAIGFALAWDGIDPLRDYRGTKDIFGRTIQIEMMNIIDSLAATAGVLMGEGKERTPVVVIRGAENISFANRSSKKKDQLTVPPEEDLFAPFFLNSSIKWKRKR